MPEDPAIWERLFTVSAAFGTSQKVYEQLAKTKPELVKQPELANATLWCRPDVDGVSIVEIVRRSRCAPPHFDGQ